jgi:hypothetical protein
VEVSKAARLHQWRKKAVRIASIRVTLSLRGEFNMSLSRRNVVSGGSMLALVTLSGCGADTLASLTGSTTAQSPLKVAASRALATLSGTGGFAATKVASVSLPVQLAGQSGGSLTSAMLADSAYRARVVAVVNTIAEAAVPAARAIIEGGITSAENAPGSSPHPATDALERATSAGSYPLVVAAIESRLAGPEGLVIDEVLGNVVGIDRTGFVADMARRAVVGIFAAIGVEEATILGRELPA